MGEINPDNVQIRAAQEADVESIVSVLAEAFTEYERLYTKPGYAVTTPKSSVIQDRLSEGEVWVALLKGKVVGTASVVPQGEALYLRSMAILPGARGNRIGEKLLTQIEKFAIANGYERLLLSTTPFLDRAIHLYEKFGFRRNGEPPHDLFGTPLITMEKIIKTLDERVSTT
jgi:ribosomal protein S18 acetylase RimI-like enzyme